MGDKRGFGDMWLSGKIKVLIGVRAKMSIYIFSDEWRKQVV